MCIRDRKAIVKASIPVVAHLGLTPQSVNAFGGYKVQARDCLLYTSDAADDLLCVDLGGRRIIKKKNTTHYYILDHHTTHHVTHAISKYTLHTDIH